MNEIRDIHEPFIAWLKKIGIPYHRNRPDKKTTAIKGDPDFLVMWMGHGLYVECKVPRNKLSPDQVKRIAYIRRAGNKVAIAYSIEECIEATKNILCVGQGIPQAEPTRSGTALSEAKDAKAAKGLARDPNEPLMRKGSMAMSLPRQVQTDSATLSNDNLPVHVLADAPVVGGIARESTNKHALRAETSNGLRRVETAGDSRGEQSNSYGNDSRSALSREDDRLNSRISSSSKLPYEHLFIAHVLGRDRVCRGSGVAGSQFEIVRVASAADMINIK